MSTILLLSHDSTLTGAPLSLGRFASALAEERPQDRYILGLPRSGPLEQALKTGTELIHYRTERWKGGGDVTSRWSRRAFRRILLSVQPATVVANTLECFQAVLAAQDLGIPCVWLIHELLENYRNRRELAGMKQAAAAATRIVFNSSASQSGLGLLGGNLQEKTAIVPPPVPAVPAARPFQVPGRTRAGCLGDICPPKRQLEALTALAPIFRDFPAFTLRLIGRVPPRFTAYRGEIEALVQKSGWGKRVEFTGETTNPGSALSQLDFLLHPSRAESFGLAVAESLAAGLPVVSSSRGGPEELIETGRTGLLVTPGDGPALELAVRRILSDPEWARALGERGREAIGKKLSFSASARALQKQIELAAAGGQG